MKHDISEVKELITTVLYDTDAAGTYCNENDLFNEYETEAEMITHQFANQGKRLLTAFKEVFDQQFDGHYDDEKLRKAYRIVNNTLNGVDPGIEP